MKKKTFILSLFIFILCISSCERNPRPGDKMESNPNAIFHGGIDGGHFFEIIEKKEDKFRIKIYLDYNEKLLFEGHFKPSDDSCGMNLTTENIHEYIDWYNPGEIFLSNPIKKNCSLLETDTLYMY